jgi:DNA-directed RNA polymerase subunit RPC12/RpoP
MAQKTIYLCSECKTEWEHDSSLPQPKICFNCGSIKIHKCHYHERFAKKSRSKVRWAYKV